MSYKSRGNYYFKWDDGNYEAVFGVRKKSKPHIVRYKSVNSGIGITEGPNGVEVVKIGREINRFKQLDRPTKKEIDKRFLKHTNSILEKKQDNSLVKKITNDIMRQLKNGG